MKHDGSPHKVKWKRNKLPLNNAFWVAFNTEYWKKEKV